VRLWGGSPVKRGADNVDPHLREIAEDVCARLGALSLHVRCTFHGRGFCEIAASSSPKIVTLPGSAQASGVALLLAAAYDPPTLVFEEINSLTPGLGRRMTTAALGALQERPGLFRRIRVDDASPLQRDGRRWWAHVAQAYPEFDWVITHDELQRRAAQPKTPRGVFAALRDWLRIKSAPPAEDEAPRRFDDTQRKLDALARAFDYDPAKVTLRPQKDAFDYLGQSFLSEGEATADGEILVYFDPAMSDARLGCCLAHEIQHARYFALRAAFRAEGDDGPLHKRFARYTPALLAAQRGVSAYSNEHWDAWRDACAPELFSFELEAGGSEPINETIAEVAKALFNWGPDVRINPVWRDVHDAINEEYAKLREI
jgi:hypothetical protein